MATQNYDSSLDLTGLQFDGVDDYVLIEENVLPDSGDYTISIWVKADSNNSSARTLIAQSDTSGNPFFFGSNAVSDTSGTIKMNEEWSNLSDTPFYLDDRWHLYTIVNDGTIGDSSEIIDTSSFFIDGEKSSLVIGIGKGYPLVERFLIGTMWDSSGEFFSGTIDDIVIWDRKLSEDEIKSLYPLINTKEVIGGIHIPIDGQADPVGVTNVLAKAAKQHGANIIEHCSVKKILIQNEQIVGVETDQGKIDCEYIVLASGMWSRQIAADVNVSVPLYPDEHFYVLTEPIEKLDKNLPVLSCLLYTSPSPRDGLLSRMPSSA